MSLTLQLQTII